MRELPRPGDLVISKSTSESLTARYAAQSYIRRRWKPIPVGFRSKRPIQWHCQHRGTTAAMQDIIFPEGKLLNVGVIQGGTSGGLTDVDLDCSEAIALAKIVLLKTAAIGGGDLGRDRGDGGGRGAGGRGADHGDGVGRSGNADSGRRGGGVGGDLGDDDSCGDGADGGGPGGGGRDRDDGGGHHCHGGGGGGSGGRATGRDGAGPGDDFGGGDSRRRDGGGGGLGRSSGDAVGRDGGRGGDGRGGHGGADVGAQTIFPGSVHESGEDIKWARDGERVDDRDLLRFARLLASLCLNDCIAKIAGCGDCEDRSTGAEDAAKPHLLGTMDRLFGKVVVADQTAEWLDRKRGGLRVRHAPDGAP